MDETEQDKSEQPTPFKLMRARQRGSVARGSDLGFLMGMTALMVFVLVAGSRLGHSVEQAVHDGLATASSGSNGGSAVAVLGLVFSPVAPLLALMAVVIFLTVLTFELIQTGFVFSSKPLKPDFSRLNPAKGLKRVFSVRLLIETLKNILKLCVYSAVGYFVIRRAVQFDAASIIDGSSLLASMFNMALRLLAAFLLVAFGFAVLDQLIVRRDFFKKMRMSRRELRRELREREGEPRLKQKRKQMHAEFAKMAQSIRNIRKADVLIVNPQHIALGLHYEPASMDAPRLVSAGMGHFAQRLKRLAFIYGIPIFENPALARELYRKTRLNGSIPDHCYRPVADLYNVVRRRRSVRTEDDIPMAIEAAVDA